MFKNYNLPSQKNMSQTLKTVGQGNVLESIKKKRIRKKLKKKK